MALKKSGYDSNNQTHHLIVLGDLFDRGSETVKVLEYLYDLSKQKKATIILGNHDVFLLDFLEKKFERTFFNIKHNGFGKTLEHLSGITPKEENLEELEIKISSRFPFLKEWLESFPLFLEMGDYIFVHGGIDGNMLDWRTMSSRRDFVWGREYNLPRVQDKIVVAGHHRVATIRKKTEDYHLLFLHSPELFDILYEEGKILIDRFVEISNEINVLILDLN